MQNRGLGPILARVAASVGALLLLGLFLKLLSLLLRPVLPPGLMQAVTDGWNTLMGLVGPAVGPLAAVGILAALLYVVIGRRR